MARKYFVLLAVSVVLLSGCSQAMTDSFFAPSVVEVKKLHQETRTLVKAHDTNMTSQHQAMSPEVAAEIGVLKEAFDDKVVLINARADEVHSKVGALVVALAEKFGLGGSFVSWVNDLVGEEIGGVEEKVDGLRDDVEVVENRLAELQTRLATVSAEGVRELELLKGDRDAFLVKLESVAELTAADMEELKGLSTESIMAMLLAAAGAAGAGGLLGKTGKSRGTGEIEKLKDRLDGITTDAALHKKVPGTV